MTLMQRRRALMGVQKKILFQWIPSNGLTGISITGTAPSAYQIESDGIKLFGDTGIKVTQIEIPNFSYSGTFTTQWLADFTNVLNFSPPNIGSESLFTIRFAGIESRINYNTYNSKILITGTNDITDVSLTGIHKISCIYKSNTNMIEWYLDTTLLATTSNPKASTTKLCNWYAPKTYYANKYLLIKKITVYEGVVRP